MRADSDAPRGADRAAKGQAGFTLVEVLVAIVVLVFGLIAITNLFLLATSSNGVARQLTAATTQASEAMEMLKAMPFAGLVPNGDASFAALDTAAPTSQRYGPDEPLKVDTDGDKVVDVYAADRTVLATTFGQTSPLPPIRVRWQIVAIDNQTRLIRVVAASASEPMRARTRVELTTYRTCTGPRVGCPAM